MSNIRISLISILSLYYMTLSTFPCPKILKQIPKDKLFILIDPNQNSEKNFSLYMYFYSNISFFRICSFICNKFMPYHFSHCLCDQRFRTMLPMSLFGKRRLKSDKIKARIGFAMKHVLFPMLLQA